MCSDMVPNPAAIQTGPGLRSAGSLGPAAPGRGTRLAGEPDADTAPHIPHKAVKQSCRHDIKPYTVEN